MFRYPVLISIVAAIRDRSTVLSSIRIWVRSSEMRAL
jgi:hypothetical protein